MNKKNERNWFFNSCHEIKILVGFSWPSLWNVPPFCKLYQNNTTQPRFHGFLIVIHFFGIYAGLFTSFSTYSKRLPNLVNASFVIRIYLPWDLCIQKYINWVTTLTVPMKKCQNLIVCYCNSKTVRLPAACIRTLVKSDSERANENQVANASSQGNFTTKPMKNI